MDKDEFVYVDEKVKKFFRTKAKQKWQEMLADMQKVDKAQRLHYKKTMKNLGFEEAELPDWDMETYMFSVLPFKAFLYINYGVRFATDKTKDDMINKEGYEIINQMCEGDSPS